MHAFYTHFLLNISRIFIHKYYYNASQSQAQNHTIYCRKVGLVDVNYHSIYTTFDVASALITLFSDNVMETLIDV